jgi:SAM-dependent methyltransferase
VSVVANGERRLLFSRRSVWSGRARLEIALCLGKLFNERLSGLSVFATFEAISFVLCYGLGKQMKGAQAMNSTGSSSRSCCPLCGSNVSEGKFWERKHQVRNCAECDLFYIWPYPSGDQLTARVKEYTYEGLKVQNAQSFWRSQVWYYKTLFPKLQPYFADARKVLDVGCGTGNLLELIAKRYPSLELHGVELNIARAEFARKLTDAHIYNISVLELPEDNTYDVITMINVFSHIPVRDLMDKVYRLIAQRGCLIIKTSEMKKNIVKSDMYDWGIPDHIQWLGMRTIDWIAHTWNFDIEWHERVPIADVIFTGDRFAAPGRSRLRNLLKQFALHVPFSLAFARYLYKVWKGERIYSSLIVLRPST